MFELKAQGFDVLFYLFCGAIPIFEHETQGSASVKRDKGLNNVVTVNNRFVERCRKLENRSGPYFIRIPKVSKVDSRDSLNFRKSRGGEDGAEYRLQLGHSMRKGIA